MLPLLAKPVDAAPRRPYNEQPGSDCSRSVGETLQDLHTEGQRAGKPRYPPFVYALLLILCLVIMLYIGYDFVSATWIIRSDAKFPLALSHRTLSGALLVIWSLYAGLACWRLVVHFRRRR